MAAVAADYCDRVLRIPKAGKRAAIAAGLAASDSVDRRRRRAGLRHGLGARARCAEMLRPFADPRVGGVTPRQAIFDVGDDPVRRLADWIEDLRYLLTVPAQSVFGQVGCLAGRTIAYRRTAFEPAVAALVRQTVFGRPAARRRRPRAHQRTAARRLADRLPVDRAGGDRRPAGLADVLAPAAALGALEPARDAAQPALAVAAPGRVRDLRHRHRHARSRCTPSSRWASRTRSAPGDGRTGLALAAELALGYVGMLVSIGVRQIPHLRRRPRDVLRLPLFVLQLTFVMVPIRILAFATMLHQSWSTRPAALPMELRHETVRR